MKDMGICRARRCPGRKVGVAILGRKNARPKLPGYSCMADSPPDVVTQPVHADPVTGAYAPNDLWDGHEAVPASRPYRILVQVCSSGGFPAPPSSADLECIRQRGFETLNVSRDDHIIVAYLLAVYDRGGRVLSFSTIRRLVAAYRQKATVLVPHTLSAAGVKGILDDVRPRRLAGQPACLEDEAERVCREQPFMLNGCHQEKGPVVADEHRRQIDVVRAFAKNLKEAVPQNYSVLTRTLARIAVLLAVSFEGLGPTAMNPEDRPYISKKMRPIVHQLAQRGLSDKLNIGSRGMLK